MHRWFGARLLSPAELPELFNLLANVCGRGGLPAYRISIASRLRRYECLRAGGPEGAAIVLTEGLLRGMTRDQVAGTRPMKSPHP